LRVGTTPRRSHPPWERRAPARWTDSPAEQQTSRHPPLPDPVHILPPRTATCATVPVSATCPDLPLLTTVPADLTQGGCRMRPWILITLCLATGMARAGCPETDTGTRGEMTRLADQIRQWDQAYHERGVSPVSYHSSDQARRRQHASQPSPSAAVRESRPTEGTPPHPVAQPGLHTTHTADPARQWIQARRQQQLWIQPSVDGAA